MTDALLNSLSKFKINRAIDLQEDLSFIIDKIKYLENDVPGKNNGYLRWKLLWEWLMFETQGEIFGYKQDIKKLVDEIVSEMNRQNQVLKRDGFRFS